MGAKNSTYATNLLDLVFNGTVGTGSAGLWSASGTITNLYVSVHTTSPGTAGAQNTGEATYSGYSRVAVARTTGGWSVNASGTVSPVTQINFQTASTLQTVYETSSFFGVGLSPSGAGTLLYFGTINPTIGVQTGITPILTVASTIVES